MWYRPEKCEYKMNILKFYSLLQSEQAYGFASFS